jgi:hypothetical protein
MASKLSGFIMAAVTSITVVACTQTETATETVSETTSETIGISLKKIQNILSESNSAQLTFNNIQYQLSYNKDFPCQATINEHSESSGTRWLKQYQFDLTDINTNSFIQSKPGRRAIIYTSTRYTPNANEKKFNPVKINNFSLQTNVTEKNQRLIITEINKAIALCEEEYSFEESEAETP